MGHRDAPTLAALDHLLLHCGGLAAHERIVVVCDDGTAAIAHAMVERARGITSRVELHQIPLLKMHGQEPPPSVAAAMVQAELVIGLTGMSMAHSEARRAASAQGARYLSLPDYSMDLLADPAVTCDYKGQYDVTRRVTDALSAGNTARVVTRQGTDLILDISGRIGNCCPGFVAKPGDLGSPPDIESNISPVETGSHGILVVDGSIPCPGLGLLNTPVTLRIEAGSVVSIEGEDTAVIDTLERMFGAAGPKARVLAELGIGLNPAARLTGAMLTDEGALGTVHCGFGSNSTMGGLNKVSFHLDFVVRAASLSVDGIDLIVNGRVLA